MPRNAKRGGGATGLGLKYSQKASSETPDDNFDDTTGQSGPNNGLAAKWTAVQGSSGTVPLLYPTVATSTYDLSTAKRARFAVGANSGDQVFWRQDWTLGVDESIVACMGIGVLTNNNTAIRPYQPARAGISLNDNDSGPRSGNYVTIGWEAFSTNAGFYINCADSGGGDRITNGYLTFSSMAVFRLWRKDTDDGYVAFAASGDSDTWHQVSYTLYPGSSTLNNLWFEMWPTYGGVNASAEAYQVTLNWVRVGTGGYDPWTYAT